MNPSFHTAVLAGAAAIAVMLAAGIAWLVMRRHAPQPPIVPPPASAARTHPSPSCFDEEWEASAADADEARARLHDALESLAGEPASRCPRCLSSRIDTRNRARKAGSTIGSVAGATGAMAAALAGAETGVAVGSFVGPVGTVFGGLAGAVIAGLVGSAAGCAAGSAVGAAIDDNILDNHVCLTCGHEFSGARG